MNKLCLTDRVPNMPKISSTIHIIDRGTSNLFYVCYFDSRQTIYKPCQRTKKIIVKGKKGAMQSIHLHEWK